MTSAESPLRKVGEQESEPHAAWADWLVRWNQFQESYIPCREQQFSLIITYVLGWWRDAPLRVLDLACGPGSIGERVLHRQPEAQVVCLDIDPWLIELGRRTIAGRDCVTWVEADLRREEWIEALPHRSFHAVVTATALHWLNDDVVERLYRDIRGVLVDDGLLLQADVIPTGSQGVMRLAREMLLRWQAAQIAKPPGEAWYTSWSAAEREPAFRALLEERDRRLGPREPRLFLSSSAHQDMMSRAGFRDWGEIWRCHENAILVAMR